MAPYYVWRASLGRLLVGSFLLNIIFLVAFNPEFSSWSVSVLIRGLIGWVVIMVMGLLIVQRNWMERPKVTDKTRSK